MTIRRVPSPDATHLAGVRVNVRTLAGFLGDLRSRITAGRGFLVATLNLDHVVKLRTSSDFAAAYLSHTHVTADGNPIVWLSRLAGEDVALLTGADLVVPVADLAAETGTPVALLGSTEAALTGAAAALTARCPGLEVVARIAPAMGFDPTGPEAEAYLTQLADSGAGVCFLALGAPKQEIFAAFATARLPRTGFVSIGAGLDFLSGHQRRAPGFVRRLAAEWLWRLLQDPGRMARRYGACLAILPGLAMSAFKVRLSRKPGVMQ